MARWITRKSMAALTALLILFGGVTATVAAAHLPSESFRAAAVQEHAVFRG